MSMTVMNNLFDKWFYFHASVTLLQSLISNFEVRLFIFTIIQYKGKKYAFYPVKVWRAHELYIYSSSLISLTSMLLHPRPGLLFEQFPPSETEGIAMSHSLVCF